MDELKQRAIRKSRVQLCTDIDFEELQHILISREIITPRTKDDILAAGGPTNQMGKFLDYLERQSNETYDCFLQILTEMKYEHLVQRLFHEWNLLKEEEVTKVKAAKCDSTTPEDWIESLPEKLRTALVTEILLTVLAQKLGSKWMPLARILGFKQYDIDNFIHYHRELYNQADRMLIEWYHRNGKSATVETLLKAMKKVGIEEYVYRDAVNDEWNELLVSHKLK